MAAQVHALSAAHQFKALNERNKALVYHLSNASWAGSRIVMRQTSPESGAILDLILELHASCNGEWLSLSRKVGISIEEVSTFLDYSARFLSNLGNYYGTGNQKFVPELGRASLARLASVTAKARQLWEAHADAICSRPPYGLGFPSATTQSAYYPDESVLTSQETETLLSVMERCKIWPENTRFRLTTDGSRRLISIWQASADAASPLEHNVYEDDSLTIALLRGDHSQELRVVLEHLEKACECASDSQKAVLEATIKSFRTGNLEDYRDSLKVWVQDRSAPIDFVFGFVEPYRDPAGIKAEFEGIVALYNDEANHQAEALVSISNDIVRLLPWVSGDNNGPFEKPVFESPCLLCVDAIAYCSSIIFPGINLPNYNDIRESHGFKGFIIVNRMAAESGEAMSIALIPEEEQEVFRRDHFQTYYAYVLLHELFGHPTGRMITEDVVRAESSPIDPFTDKPCETWYKSGQTWTGVFGDLATTLDECRCELVSVALMASERVLTTLGFGVEGQPQLEDIQYNLFQQLGCDGLIGLSNYQKETRTWGSAHSQAHFAMLQWLLAHGAGVVEVQKLVQTEGSVLKVYVDRSKVLTDGIAAVREMLLRLHIFRCTADARRCRTFYEGLSSVSGESAEWHAIINATPSPRKVFVQGNIIKENGALLLKDYPATAEGLVQSWAERYA